jgi:hypothetical protein
MAKKIGIYFLFGLVFYLIFSFYFWTISYGHAVHLDKKNHCYYNLLSEGFLSGMLNLSIDPSPGLLSLPNPYDHIKNTPYRLHDASLYNGKYYLYFGPVPALVLYIPCMLITGMYLRDHIAIFIFSFLSLFWVLGIFLFLKEKYFQKTSYFMILFALFIVAFSDVAIYNLRRPHIYEVAISCGMFFLIGAIYFLCNSFKNDKPKIVMLLFASVFIGLSVGARPNFVFMGILLLITALKVYRSNIQVKSKIVSICSLLIPYSLLIIAICVYNYMRFDSPFQFGNKYQLAAMDMSQYKILDVNSILLGLYLYLFSPMKINSNFPFAYLNADLPAYLKPATPYFLEKASGIISFIPFLLLGLFTPALMILLSKLKSAKLEKIVFPKFELLIILLPGLINLLFITSLNGVAQRYAQDFAIYFIMATIFLWFYFYSKTNNILIKKVINSFVFFSGVLSILFGVALSIMGCYEGLKEQNPHEFDKLSSEYSFLSEVIHSVAPLWGEY